MFEPARNIDHVLFWCSTVCNADVRIWKRVLSMVHTGYSLVIKILFKIEWIINLCRVGQFLGRHLAFNPFPAELSYLNFHPLQVVSRYRDPQLQAGENYVYLLNFRPNDSKVDV